MCEKCDAAEKKSNELAEQVSKVLTSNNADNFVVFIVAAKLMVSAIAALQMPPKEFLSVVCDMYTRCTGTEIIPLQMGPIQIHPDAKDSN